MNFDDLKKADLIKYQHKLDKLCMGQGMQPWKITSGKNQWRNLVLSLCGIPLNSQSKKKGRPARTEEKIWQIGSYIHFDDMFEDLTKLSGQQPLPAKRKQLYKRAAEQFQIKPKTSPNGKTTNPEEVVRGIYRQFVKLYNQSLIDREYEDWGTD